jgi:penicillin-insensitive murein endopeptidase
MAGRLAALWLFAAVACAACEDALPPRGPASAATPPAASDAGSSIPDAGPNIADAAPTSAEAGADDGGPVGGGAASASVSEPKTEADAASEPEGDASEEGAESIDDDTDDEGEPSKLIGTGGVRPMALDLDDSAFANAIKSAPASLGSISIGRPRSGILVNGVMMPESAAWRLVDRLHAWGTQESVDAVVRAVGKVVERFPESDPLCIGDLSAQRGGPLSPHKSHQSGRDVDIGYYYLGHKPWFARATASNLDRARSWTLLKALVEADVEMIFVDTSVQLLLRDFALSHGETREFVDRVFQVGSHNPRPVVRDVPGHATHLHVRFTNPASRAVGLRAAPFFHEELARVANILAARQREALLARQRAAHAKSKGGKGPHVNAKGAAGRPPPPAFIEHRVHEGDTLFRLSQQYRVSMETIQRVNGLRTAILRPNMVLRIPKS